MKGIEITRYLESRAPRSLQEDYDNSGWIAGNPSEEVTGVLVSLDCTEAVVDEAVAKGCNLIVSHHPIVFRGLKKLTGASYVERTVIKAIRSNVGLYAIHTNLDNIREGVNKAICDRLGLVNTSILVPKKGRLLKLVVFCQADNAEKVRSALFSAGAGHIGNYSECSFNLEGKGTFRPEEGSNPTSGQFGIRAVEDEVRVEVILPDYMQEAVLKSMKEAHTYEEVAHYMTRLENTYQDIGTGMVGELETPADEMEFLQRIQSQMKAGGLRYTDLRGKPVRKVAVCGGSGSSFLKYAIAQGADFYITADFKYHEFFDAEGRIVIADIGHFESEQFTSQLLVGWLKGKISTFAVHLSEVKTNPVNYL